MKNQDRENRDQRRLGERSQNENGAERKGRELVIGVGCGVSSPSLQYLPIEALIGPFGTLFNSEFYIYQKGLLVEFYAPWCGHYKESCPSAFKNEEDVVIVVLDVDSHKDLVEKYGVSGFPTIKLFPKNNKDGEDYDGGRDIDSFPSFINEKCGTSM
ncbi:hypothetical protein LXL04_013774 [Taraxacum kok-saghyz]